MINFYAASFHALGRWAWRFRLWMHTHPVRARILIIVLLVIYLNVIQSQNAHAAGFLPEGVDFEDSRGNKFSQYSTINIDPGDVWSPGKVIVNFVVQLLWSIQYFMTGVVIWLFGFLLSFEWVAWLAVPFNTLAEWLQGQLSSINWIPFALTISALVGGAAILFGRVGRGVWEIVVALVISVLAVGVLANPVATLTATDGMLSSAQTFGGQLASAIVVDPSMVGQTQETMSAAVTSQLMEIFIRIPYQVISYSMVLPNECQAIFDTFIQSGEPQQALRDCAPAAAVFSFDNPGAMNIMNAGVNGSGVSILMLFGMAIATLLIIAVFFFLVAAIKSMINAYLGVAPVDRGPLWRAVSDTFMGLISIIVMTVCLALYLKLITWIMTQTGGLPHQLRMVLVMIFLAIIIFLIWRARRATLLAGRNVASKLSHLGLGMQPGAKDANALLKMSAVTGMAKTGYDLLHRSPTKKMDAPAARPAEVLSAGEPVAPINYTATRVPEQSTPSRPEATPSRAGAARKALDAGSSVATVAKGAASGGLPGALVAAGTVMAKGATKKVAGAALARATKTPKSEPVDVGDFTVMTIQETPPSRIEIDSHGTGTATRKPSPVVHDISSLSSGPAPSSPRALEMRRRLEAFRPKELASR